MAWTVTLNGNIYTQESFAGYNYAIEATGLPAALNDIMFHAQNVLKSSCSDTIDLSALQLQTTLNITVEINKYFEVNQALLLSSSSNPNDLIFGTVTAYNPDTGVLALTIEEVVGTATYSNWVAALGLGKLSVATAADSASASASAQAAASSAGTADTDAIAAGNSAAAAVIDAQTSLDNKNYSEEWATQPEDVPVTVAAGGDNSTTFSSLHHAAKAGALVAGNVFDDNIESSALGWTSQKISLELNKQEVNIATLNKFGAIVW